MNRYYNIKMMYKILAPVSLLLVIALGGLLFLNQYYTNKAITAVASRELHAMARESSNEITSFLNIAADASKNMVSIVKNMKKNQIPFSREDVISMIQGFLNANKDFVGAGSGWEKDSFDGNDIFSINQPGSDSNGLFIPYIISGEAAELLTEIEISEWYSIPKNDHRQVITSPYMYELDSKNVLMTTASTPVIIDNMFRGVITIDVTLDVITKKIDNFKLYRTGYAFLIAEDGTILTHPQKEFIGKDNFNLDTESTISKDDLHKGKVFSDLHEIEGVLSYYVYSPVKLGDSGKYWYLVISVPQAEVLEESRAAFIATSLSALGTLLLALIAIFIIVKVLVRPLVTMVEAADSIAQGNLQYNIDDSKFGGEIRQLSKAMKSMITSLLENISKAQAQTDVANNKGEEARIAMEKSYKSQEEAESKHEIMLATAAELEGIATVITEAAENLSMQIEKASLGAKEQASRISTTATVVDTMSAAILDVAQNANASADLSFKTKDEATDGAKLTEQCKDSINVVRLESLTLKEGMNDLSRHAQAINDIMSVISDIADQTNLLALNAAIEAARAGEAGRGFAVVADEVRKLAEKTMASTTDVGNAIRAIQLSSDTNAKQVDSTVDKIQEVTVLAEKCGESLNRIVLMADNAAEEVRSIATASEQQSVSSGEIASAVSQVNTIAGETLQMMEESKDAVVKLSQQSHELTRLIELIKQG